MELTKNHYPALADHISVSEVVTPGGSEILIYDTVTGIKKRPNRAVFDFLTLANGMNTLEKIAEELSMKSGEPLEDVWPGLSTIAFQMVENGQLILQNTPSSTPRDPLPCVRLVRRLESVSFEITRRCNLRCRHCYSNAGVELEDELTLEEIRTLIDQLSNMGVLSITFTGGEPLLHPHLFEVMEYARKKPLTVLFFTNATLLTRETAEKLKALRVYKVNVSIDGPDPATHDAFRRMEGAFERTVQAVKYAREAGLQVHASVSVTRHNYQKMTQVLYLLKDLGITEFKIWPISFSGRAEEKDIFIAREEFKEVMEALRDFEFKELGKKKDEFKYSKSVKNCGIGTGSLAIKSNGSVTPCPAFGESASLGNIRTHSVAELWNGSPLLNRLRNLSVYKTEICRDCNWAAVCKGGCIADIYERSGVFTCYDEYVCVGFEVTKDDFIPVEVDDTPSGILSVEVS